MSMWLGHLFWHGGRQYALWSREDQLEVGPADPAQLVGLGVDDHARLGGARAGDRRLVLALDLAHAHPAGAEARQLGLVAQRRDLDAVVAADLEDRLALEPLDDAPVDLDPDPRRALRPLRALGRDEALGQRVLAGRGRVVDGGGVGARVRDAARGASSGRTIRSAISGIPVSRRHRPRWGDRPRPGQVLRRRWSSSSDRKYRIPLVNGRVARRSCSHSAGGGDVVGEVLQERRCRWAWACPWRRGRRSRTAGAGRSGRGSSCRTPRRPRTSSAGGRGPRRTRGRRR